MCQRPKHRGQQMLPLVDSNTGPPLQRSPSPRKRRRTDEKVPRYHTPRRPTNYTQYEEELTNKIQYPSPAFHAFHSSNVYLLPTHQKISFCKRHFYPLSFQAITKSSPSPSTSPNPKERRTPIFYSSTTANDHTTYGSKT